MTDSKNPLVRSKAFIGEVQTELKKSVWPTRSELYNSTIVVIVSVIILAVFVGISDGLLVWLVGLLVG